MSTKTARQSAETRLNGCRRTRFAAAAAAVAVTTLALGTTSASADPVPLGTATSFAVLAGSGITNTGATTITGDMGSSPTPAGPLVGITLDGADHGDDDVTDGAKVDLLAAYVDAFNRPTTNTIPVELGGSTLLPGVYDSLAGTFGLTGTLTLDGLDDPASVFVFQMASELTTAAASSVLLINGANPCQIVWQVGSSATFGADTVFVGDVLADTSITAGLGATFDGRLLAVDGAVTLHNNTITIAACVDDVEGDGDGSPVVVDEEPAAPTPTTAAPTPTTAAPTPTSSTTTSTTVPTLPVAGAATVTGAAARPPTLSAGGLGGPDAPAAGSPGAPRSPGSPPALARTGSAIGGLLSTGLVLVVLGIICTAAGRRRHAGS